MDCPSDAELEDLKRGIGDEALAAHVRACAQCQSRVSSVGVVGTTVLASPGPQGNRTFDSDRTLERERPADGALAEGTAVGPYVVSKRLGAGAMGAVYAAWDPRLEREVALKVLHLEGDLLDEARLLAKLSHPNVVAVHEVFTWQERAVLVMERVHGTSLREWLTREPRSRTVLLEVFRQCAEGLAAAHAAGVIHRDFKPDNVLVDETGRARLVDFGLAMRAVHASGGLAGSPAYMALAQLEGAPADERSDQFSWWASLYEALCRRLPADARSISELFEARRRPVSLDGLPLRLRKAVARGLSNDPALRFPSMRAAAAAIRPRRPFALAAGAAAVLLATMGVVATRTPDPCAGLTVEATALAQRTRDPALLAEVARYAEEQQRCSALPAERRTRRAQCLEQVGQELDLAVTALDGLRIDPALHPRVLKRVRPAGRCAAEPVPPAEVLTPQARPALVASLRVQLEFDALRIAGDMKGAYELAHRHLAGLDATAPPVVRAWAEINEVSALTTVGRGSEAVDRFRELEGLGGAGLRERTWIALGRWRYECHVSAGPQCEVAGQQAQRLATELDEPWARAFEAEIAAGSTGDPTPVVERWRQVPGAVFEVERTLGNAALKLVTEGDIARRRQVLALARSIEHPTWASRGPLLRLELAEAVREGDLARAAELLRALEPEVPGLFERLGLRSLLLMSAGHYREVLALEQRHTHELRLDQRLLLRVGAQERLRDPATRRTLDQLAVLEGQLSVSSQSFLDAVQERAALDLEDEALLPENVIPDSELERAWQLAALRHDAAAEAEVLHRAAADQGLVARRLRLEALVREGRFEEVARLGPELRAEAVPLTIECPVRVLEAWSLWQLGRREEACRVMTWHSVLQALVRKERARADTLLRECPRVGISELPAWVLVEP